MSNTIENPLETLSITNSNSDEASTFNYVNNCLVKKFYEFMADIYIEHKKIYEQYLKDLLDEKIVTMIQPFSQYFLYKLYYHYGVKRRMANDHIALLYYSKTAKGYKNTDPITMLCRHMLLDLKCMRIISLGIPKAVKLDDFCNTYSINKTDASTNYIKKDVAKSNDDKSNDDKSNDQKTNKYDMYYFSEGTMMTYNPSLSKYNITFVDYDSDDEEEDYGTETKTETKIKIKKNDSSVLDKSLDLEKPVEVKFNNQFIYSTRKILGTGKFNSSKSFLQMFLENNTINKINLESISEEYIKDTVLVFNIEHPDNNIISTIKRNSNILCGVFKFKNEEQSIQEFEQITSINYSSETENNIKTHFSVLGNDMVSQIKVKDFKQTLYDNNIKVNLQLPKLIKYFEKSSSDKETNKETNKETESKTDKENETDKDKETNKEIDVNTFSLEQLEYIVDNKSKFFHGYIIYGKNGERTKITNKKYKNLCELKGNKPITLEQCNIKNLFYLYNRLIKQKNVHTFLKEFDTENTIIQPVPFQFTLISYKQTFMWFYSLINNYALTLFKVYHYSFVKKTFDKKNIPFSLKPLCGDLHTLYKSNSVPITKSIIEQYLVEQPASKLYWRLFDNTKDELLDISLIQ